VTVSVKLNYRKFDAEYMRWIDEHQRPGDTPLRGSVAGQPYTNELPILTLAEDRVTFEVAGGTPLDTPQEPRDIPEWQRWNDYGIGLLLKGKAELRQAEAAFSEVEKLGRYDGPLNLARVYFREGRLDEAAEAIGRAAAYDDPPAPAWTMSWLSGQINRQQGRLEEAEANFRAVLEGRTQEMVDRKLDFSRDYEVRNLLGLTLYDRASQFRGAAAAESRTATLQEAARQFEKTLEEDVENAVAHYNLGLIYSELGETEQAQLHRSEHQKYKLDDNAADRAVRLARERYPAANHAAEAVVIYPLQRPDGPVETDTLSADPSPAVTTQEPTDISLSDNS
jgi:tetratricopeptide (TPR) repeat protein